jgi:hypothetical protein
VNAPYDADDYGDPDCRDGFDHDELYALGLYEDVDDDEWTEGTCDHCYGGEPTMSHFGPLYCACVIGQGAAPEDCLCGPGTADDAPEGGER